MMMDEHGTGSDMENVGREIESPAEQDVESFTDDVMGAPPGSDLDDPEDDDW